MDAKTVFALLGVCSMLAAGGCGSRDSGEDDDAAPAAPTASNAAPAVPAGAGPSSDVPLVEQNLAYGEAANTNLIGYLVMPADAVEPLPGLIVIHGEAGLDEETRELTRRLAGERYIALAVDLYAGSSSQDGSDAATRAGALIDNAEATLGNIRQAYNYLTKYAFVPTVAAIGMSSGGSWALRAGIALPGELDAVVMYDGQIITESAALSQLTAPVLGHFAGLDESTPAADARIFRVRLGEEGKRAEINIYPNVQRGFASVGSPTYDAAAADEAWQRTLEFLDINL
ncbi:MAG TPA: dienelactone hydrolase family protein [Gammaproteobacteria bacterium]